MTAAPVRLERDGALAAMALHDPPLNLFGPRTFEALSSCLDEVEGSDARALVWRAEGELFTGGADVNDFQRSIDDGSAADRFGELIAAVRRLEALEIPSLALVHGLCLTAGLEIALGCDILWASESAKFGLVEADAGRRRHPAHSRARRPGAGARVRDERRPLRCRHARALERGQPRRRRRRA